MKFLIVLSLLLAGCEAQVSGYVPTHEERKNQNICKGALKKEIMKRFDVCMEQQEKIWGYIEQATGCKSDAIEFICPMGSLEALK